MMYLLTEQEHAQLKDAVAYGANLGAYEMLKAMKPVEPCAWMRKDDDMITAKEKRPDYAYTHYYDKPLYAKEQQ